LKEVKRFFTWKIEWILNSSFPKSWSKLPSFSKEKTKLLLLRMKMISSTKSIKWTKVRSNNLSPNIKKKIWGNLIWARAKYNLKLSKENYSNQFTISEIQTLFQLSPLSINIIFEASIKKAFIQRSYLNPITHPLLLLSLASEKNRMLKAT
jgi:hypothetical protein